MFKKILPLFFVLLAITPSFSAENGEFSDFYFNEGQMFRRKESTAYLKCYYALSSEEHGVSLRSFEILPKEGVNKHKVVGKIGTKYYFNERRIDITSLEIEPQYRRCGYGEAAIRTVLGIYRSPKNAHVVFDKFWLTVGMGHDREAARALYFKVGFVIEEELKNTGFCNLALSRQKNSTS